MTVENGRSPGPWLPTSYLRVFQGELQQKFRRRVKHYLTSATGKGFGARTHTTYEYEWQKIPTED